MRGAGSGLVLGLHRSGHDRLILEHALTTGIRALDTAYNYRRFTSHRTLASTAADLLGEFTISTKVGFFPGERGTPVHSLDPVRLRDAIDESATTLGVVPEVVFLHNPERALPGTDPAAELDRLATACQALDEARTAGLCRSWGLSSWDTRPLAAALPDTTAAAGIPVPRVLMVRAGLLVTADVLDTSEHLADIFGLPTGARWGMSPFGGNAAHPVWDTVDPREFLAPQQNSTVAQAVLRVAFTLPAVGRIAVGTDNPAHLDALIAATGLEIDHEKVARYRDLLRARMVRTAAR
ncbi:MAG: aldo/keto reductase [Pseudonocardia sp.]